MNNKLTIGIVVAVLVIGAGVFFYLNSSDDTDNNTSANESTVTTSQPQSADEVEVTEQEVSEDVSLEDALSEIGATGNEGPVNGTTYTFEGVEYKFDVPSDWGTSMNQRQQACEQGYINTGYQIATDGETWFATTDFNEDLAQLVNALSDAGIEAVVDSYCL